MKIGTVRGKSKIGPEEVRKMNSCGIERPDNRTESLTPIREKSVAVLMSTFNGESWISPQIESIQNQIGVEVMLYIRDDGSTDKTLSLLESYQSESIILMKSGGRLGPKDSFLWLLENCPQHDFYAFADQDDVWDQDKLLISVNCLSNSSIPELYCSNVRLWKSNSKDLEISTLPIPKLPLNYFENSAMGCTIVMNEQAKKLIRVTDSSKSIMHDWHLLLIVSLFGKIHFDTNAHMNYRIHPHQTIGWKKNRKVRTILDLTHTKQLIRQINSFKLVYEKNTPSYMSNSWQENNQFLHSRRKLSSFILSRHRLRSSVIADILLRLKIFFVSSGLE